MGGAITILNREEKGPYMATWCALDENEYEHPNIAASETHFLDTLFSVECSARALTRDVERGDPRYS